MPRATFVSLPSALLAAGLMALGGAAGAHLPFPERDGVPSLAPVLRDITPAVVNVSVLGTAQAEDNPLRRDPFFRRFFEERPDQAPVQPQESAGSGVIVDADKGYVLTNHHVVAEAREIVVTLTDGRRLPATLVGDDPGTDIALLKVEVGGLTAIAFGDSDALAVGDFVVAIGNPFGLGQTVTSGIVSALGRSGINVEGYEDFIQTDASINPGNSGGALINIKGELIGINTAIIGPTGGNVGIGFAVPSNMARSVMAQLVEFGEVRRGRLGVRIQDLTPELAEALRLDLGRGAVVTRVERGSPAEAAGIRAGDVVVAVNGRKIESAGDLRNHVGLARVGDQVKMTVIREGRRETLVAKIGELETVSYAADESAPQVRGAVFQAMGREHPLHGQLDGVIIASVDRGSPAWQNGLRPDDVIVAVNRSRVRTVEDLLQTLSRRTRVIALDIVRGDTRLFLVIQ